MLNPIRPERCSVAALLYANENDVKTAQELMRHSTPIATMPIYAQALTEAKKQAQERLASLILEPEPEALSA